MDITKLLFSVDHENIEFQKNVMSNSSFAAFFSHKTFKVFIDSQWLTRNKL